MRFPALLLALALPCAALPAAYWESNALGQRTRPADGPLPGWWLEENGGTTRLYEGSTLVKTTTTNGDRVTITADGSVTERLFSGGLLMTETVTDASGTTTSTYEYADGGILRRITTEGPSGTSVRQYSWSPALGLVSVTGAGDGVVTQYSASSIGWAAPGGEAATIDTSSPGLLLSGFDASGAVPTEDGGWVVEDTLDGNTVRTTFGPSMELLREETIGEDGTVISSETREYDSNGDLMYSRSTASDGKVTDRHYAEGVLRGTVVMDADLNPVETLSPGEGGTWLRTVYRDGAPYALVRLDQDGSRVLSLEML